MIALVQNLPARCSRTVEALVAMLSFLNAFPMDAQVAQSERSTPVSAPIATLPDTPARRAALTVEGGGTLGTYEAGLTWTLVEMFRQRRMLLKKPEGELTSSERFLKSFTPLDFKAAAGASAGSINAFIAAARWCSSDPAKTERTSPFWLVWVPTGVTKLLPRQKPSDWQEQKAVLTREIFTPILTELDDSLQHSDYQPGCDSPLFGASITRLAADSLPIPLSTFAVRNQRFASAFAVKTNPGGNPRLSYSRIDRRSEVPLGAFAELPDSTEGEISHGTVHDLLKASSGYPLAFAPQPVTYCFADVNYRRDISETRVCPPGLKPRRAYFVDGGVFDNGPLTIGYGLALTGPQGATMDNLYMLFVTPNRCRTTFNRCGFAGLRDSSRVMAAALLNAKSVADENQADGLDAFAKLLSVSIPSARQYELQVAGRILPVVLTAHSKEVEGLEAVKSITEELVRYQRRDSLQFDLDSAIWSAGRADVGDLKLVNEQLRAALSRCLLLGCDLADDYLTLADPRLRNRWLEPATRIALAVKTPTTPFARQANAGVLLVTDRWHPLAGDWLFGFGGFLGRPLREYDFYVGIYDALVVLAKQMSVTDSIPFPAHLRRLVTDPPILMSPTARVILRALYNVEFKEAAALSLSLEAPDFGRPSVSDSLLIGIVEAMRAMSDSLPPVKECGGGPIERIECSEGLDVAFEAMHRLPYFKRALEAARESCEKTYSKKEACQDDDTFDDFVNEPYSALNRLVGDALERLLDATPPGSGLRMPLTIASATYFATNERARTGFDQGSVSLPPGLGRMKRNLFWLIPSSIGGYGGIPGWYSEWAGRWHYDPDVALGATMRYVWASGLAGPASPKGRHIVPSLRIERKWGGAPSLIVGTFGFDLSYWADWQHGGFIPVDDKSKGWSFAFTSAMFAEKLRMSIGYRPTKYVTRTSSTSRVLFSIGAGDVTGTLYWIYRSFDH